MKIAEIYRSIQGEGPAIGDCATFIRTSGCNLDCQGCNVARHDGAEMSINDVVEVVKRMNNDIVVVTGGEPFIQPEVPELIKALDENDFVVDVETNGTCYVPEAIQWAVRFFLVSPKKGYPIHHSVFDQRFITWKFTIGPHRCMWSVEEVVQFIECNCLNKSTVYLMPYDVIDAKAVWDKCIEYGLNYSDRLSRRINNVQSI
ncbi:MAG: 7-carboxy-7-deazaguanine synthase [Phage 5P_1]|nr:MAG: 7-carboxy-7-deazaguanine synthase [Phage 5P_1]